MYDPDGYPNWLMTWYSSLLIVFVTLWHVCDMSYRQQYHDMQIAEKKLLWKVVGRQSQKVKPERWLHI